MFPWCDLFLECYKKCHIFLSGLAAMLCERRDSHTGKLVGGYVATWSLPSKNLYNVHQIFFKHAWNGAPISEPSCWSAVMQLRDNYLNIWTDELNNLLEDGCSMQVSFVPRPHQTFSCGSTIVHISIKTTSNMQLEQNLCYRMHFSGQLYTNCM